LKTINPDLKIIGYTGTNFRATEGRLTEGDNRLFTDVAYQIPMLYLIEKGFLCPLVTPAVTTKMDTAGVRTQNGDYIEKQLQAAVDKDHITRSCVDEIILHGSVRRKWLVFAAGIEHCTHVRDEIRSRGISCEMVLGSTPDAERRRIVDEYKNGELRCLVNVGCFTTGFNNPAIDLMAFMRPTRSRVLYVQMGGRGMRISPGKADCTLLDFGGVIKELGPIDMVDAHKASNSSGDGDAPVKLCPQCNSVCFAGSSACHDCGFEFPVNPLALSKKASNLAVLSVQIEPEWHEVVSVRYSKHSKPGKAPSMCVTYNTLDGPYREWVCYEHTGYAREKACQWHKRRCNNVVIPKTIEEALINTFSNPTRISTRQAGKYHEIVGYDFTEKTDEVSPDDWTPQTPFFKRMEESSIDDSDVPF
jgi:DNA repair protein RadD